MMMPFCVTPPWKETAAVVVLVKPPRSSVPPVTVSGVLWRAGRLVGKPQAAAVDLRAASVGVAACEFDRPRTIDGD